MTFSYLHCTYLFIIYLAICIYIIYYGVRLKNQKVFFKHQVLDQTFLLIKKLYILL